MSRVAVSPPVGAAALNETVHVAEAFEVNEGEKQFNALICAAAKAREAPASRRNVAQTKIAARYTVNTRRTGRVVEVIDCDDAVALPEWKNEEVNTDAVLLWLRLFVREATFPREEGS